MSFKNNPRQKTVFLILLLGCILILTVHLASPPASPFPSEINTSEDVITFLNELGWEADFSQLEITQSQLPIEFDGILNEYNALQKQQKCDLMRFAGKEINVYTIPITNYGSNDQTVYATLLVHNKRVIGGDIHSAKMDGFMHTLT